jgi:tryptophan halogenase
LLDNKKGDMVKVNKIAIVGGGSAGWMTAAILKKSYPEKEIVVVESPSIPTVGVGESTYDGINWYLEYLGINRDDFFKYTDASIKLGIEFANFYEKDGTSFIYPFGIPCIEDTAFGMQDWWMKKYKNPEIPVTDFAESFFPVAHLIKNNTFNENLEGRIPNYDAITNTAFHFDATKFADWLKNNYCLPRGVVYIVDEVEGVVMDGKAIKELEMSSGVNIGADLFVDCTGFKSLLLGNFMKEPFVSFSDKLPNNSAWATQVEYDEKNKELTTVTKCTALGNGWAWNIPLYSRLGAGYVYSNKFTSKEDALEEFKEYLCSDMMDVPKTREVVDSLTFKHIDMRVGIHERVWVENVVAIGLSAGFIEPLESNGLFTIHEFLFYLVRALNREKVTSWDINVFNQCSMDLYKAFAEFIRIHYSLSIRDDTEYWKHNSTRDYSYSDLYLDDFHVTYTLSLYNMKTRYYNADASGGIPTGIACISTGMNYFLLDNVSGRNGEIGLRSDFSDLYQHLFDDLEEKKKSWEKIAKDSKKLPQYLKEKYHKE